ncbi:MAG: bifunctional oligoribonuclease/PAP phosphatase NrnA [Prevotellaceae bacterium]|jgi:phosphoesterase RecJ-like protein|nr:bifunctional oligoribonuclease/PAP phosphatase NrnA [Prevotellaceae bacterium]
MLTKIIPQEAVNQTQSLLEASEAIVIVTHISPDGDALGSSLGLYWMLKEMNKTATVITPNRFPHFLQWLPGASDIVVFEEDKSAAEQIIHAADLIFCLDFNSASRINGMRTAVLDANASRVMVDHHTHPDMLCDVVISHPAIASTSELVFRLICRMGYREYITLPAAEAIYTGMMTDTGNFSYNSQSPEIYSIIHELLLIGIDKDAIYRRVYNNYSADRMRLLGYCLCSKMTVYPEFRAAIIVLTKEETDRFNYQIGDSEGFVNVPLSIKDVDISIFVREDNDKIKLSFRSQGDIVVNRMAEAFKGGGHKNAAGGESYMSMDKTIQKLQTLISHWEDYQ